MYPETNTKSDPRGQAFGVPLSLAHTTIRSKCLFVPMSVPTAWYGSARTVR